MSLVWAALVATMGIACGPLLRAQIFRYSVPAPRGQHPSTGWRHECPACLGELVASGWRLSALPPTGRCPRCRTGIGPPRWRVEAVTAAVLALLTWRIGVTPTLPALVWVALLGVVLAFVDVAVHRLPDRLTLSTFAGAAVLLGAAALIDGAPSRLGWAVVYGCAMAACYFVLVLLHPAGMGLGDAKLSLGVGVVLGWFGWFATVMGAASGFLLAGLYAAVMLLTRTMGGKDQIPHGPFMLLGALGSVMLLG